MGKQLIRYIKRGLIFIFIVFCSIKSLSAQEQNLEFFLTSALNNSPLLKDYTNRVRSSQIDSMRIRAGQGIQVNAQGINAYAPVVNGWGYDEIKTDIAEVSAVVQVSKEITWNRNLQNKYEAIRLQNQASLLEGNLSAKDLKKTVILQYILTYGDQLYQELNSEVLNVLRQEELIVKKLAEKGSYRQTEYLSFEVNIRQQEILSEKYGIQLRTDLETLNYLCGIYDTTLHKLSPPDLKVETYPGISNSLFYRQFVIDSLKLVNDNKRIDFDYQPKLSIFADGGYLSSLAITPWKNFGLSAGINISVPIYDGKQRQMQHDQIAISESTRSNYRDFFANQYLQQISILENQLTSMEQITQKTIEQQKFALTLVNANRVLLNTGDIPVTDYLLSVNNYLDANNMLIENTIERFRLINELNYWTEK
jgi:outer membrane protein TolC